MQKKISEYSYFSPVVVQPLGLETVEQFKNRWSKFDALSDTVKNKLSSDKISETVKLLKERFSLNLIQTGSISRSVRSYYFGELKLENLASVFTKEMGIDLNKAQEIAKAVVQKIINDKSQEIAYEAQLAHLTIPDALKKFPDLGEQLITSNHINIKSFPEPVRPSIKNWLFDYTFNMGHETHDSMTHGTYLFQNANAKALSAADRQKLEYVLKAYDENTPVTVNMNTKQMLFPTAGNNEQRTTINKIPAASSQSNIKYQTPNTNPEPEDIFQKTQENEREYFSGTVVQNRQWTNLPKETPSAKPAPAPSPILRPTIESPEPRHQFTPPAPVSAPQIKNPQPAQTITDTRHQIPDTKIEFSSPHKLPVEKQIPAAPKFQLAPILPKPRPIPVAPKPQPLPVPAPPQPRPAPQPIRIFPSGFNDESISNSPAQPPSKNIVNLKE
jgi:hypothetical protein